MKHTNIIYKHINLALQKLINDKIFSFHWVCLLLYLIIVGITCLAHMKMFVFSTLLRADNPVALSRRRAMAPTSSAERQLTETMDCYCCNAYVSQFHCSRVCNCAILRRTINCNLGQATFAQVILTEKWSLNIVLAHSWRHSTRPWHWFTFKEAAAKRKLQLARNKKAKITRGSASISCLLWS